MLAAERRDPAQRDAVGLGQGAGVLPVMSHATVLLAPRGDVSHLGVVVEGCARVRATLVVFLPSDLPGGEALLTRASDVVLLTDRRATGSAALRAGLEDRLRAGLMPPEGAPAEAAPDDAASATGEDLAQEPIVAGSDSEPAPVAELAAEAPLPPAPGRPSQSQLAQQAAEAVEPPPRRDFEIVRRPIRRTPPTFQVERRSLPRRV